MKVGGKSIANITDLSLADALAFVRGLRLSAREAKIGERVLKIDARTGSCWTWAWTT